MVDFAEKRLFLLPVEDGKVIQCDVVYQHGNQFLLNWRRIPL
jgi:hypothetical protein